MTTIIFDLQGTLAENGVFPSPVKQVKYLLRIEEEFHSFVVKFEDVFMTKSYESLADAFSAVALSFDRQPPGFVFDKLVGVWNKNKLLSKLYPDVVVTLQSLKSQGHTLILYANIDQFSKDLIAKFELEQYFDAVYLSCDLGLLKGTGLLEKIMNDQHLNPQETVLVGDSMESDINPAMALGLKAVLVDRHDRREHMPKISTISELHSVL